MKTQQLNELGLWHEWKTSGDPKVLSTLLDSLDPIIEKEVNIYKTARIPKDALKLHAQGIAINALASYDPSRSQINTHLINSLKKVSRYVYENQNIGKIPEHRVLMIGSYKSIKSQLEEKLNREPTTFEIAEEMKVPFSEIEKLETELRQDLTIKNESIDEDGGSFFLDAQLYTDTTKEALDFLYHGTTDPTDKKIIEYYFGMYGTQKRSATEISQLVGISYPTIIKKLKGFAQSVIDIERNLNS